MRVKRLGFGALLLALSMALAACSPAAPAGSGAPAPEAPASKPANEQAAGPTEGPIDVPPAPQRQEGPSAFGVPEQSEAAFRGDLQRSGVYRTHGPGESPHLKWKFSTGDGVYSSPAVAAGTVYFGSRDGYLYAVNTQTGRLEWKFQTGAGIESSPVVAEGIVFCGSEDGQLYALSDK
ncbi:PQQ-binding-like beta-propeller repeat protein [Gelria sp. Kuro-4]|uniref:outer membrane protein assembly factor BamB family protein n=1 Tax=Gelria sp. Kuro-4 TaxID=2796927 RepID=UPI001BED95A9|nr:PQQ-binding-like beta-propeller repeat protein [Gelria sp. Kuro-4]BCV24412.1 hypothetical protein kuro4_11850 [Gelria sp. Kuro-4]